MDYDDRDLIACFNIIYELYPDAPDNGPEAFLHSVPSLVESREALRLFTQIQNPEMRTAVRMLMRALTMPPSTSADPICHRRSVANRPN